MDKEAIEIFLQSAAQDALLGVTWHADRLALLRRHRDDRVEIVRGCWREAYGNFVDDTFPEDRVEHVDRSKDWSREACGGWLFALRDREVAHHLHSQGCVGFDPIGEVLREGAGAGNDHVIGVAALAASGFEPSSEERPPYQGDARLDDEEEAEEEPAHVVLVEEKQQRKRDRQHDDRASQDVARLGKQSPADAKPIQTEGPKDTDPRDREQSRRRPDIDADGPLDARIGLEADDRDEQEYERGSNRVRKHEQDSQGHQMAPGHLLTPTRIARSHPPSIPRE